MTNYAFITGWRLNDTRFALWRSSDDEPRDNHRRDGRHRRRHFTGFTTSTLSPTAPVNEPVLRSRARRATGRDRSASADRASHMPLVTMLAGTDDPVAYSTRTGARRDIGFGTAVLEPSDRIENTSRRHFAELVERLSRPDQAAPLYQTLRRGITGSVSQAVLDCCSADALLAFMASRAEGDHRPVNRRAYLAASVDFSFARPPNHTFHGIAAALHWRAILDLNAIYARLRGTLRTFMTRPLPTLGSRPARNAADSPACARADGPCDRSTYFRCDHAPPAPLPRRAADATASRTPRRPRACRAVTGSIVGLWACWRCPG